MKIAFISFLSPASVFPEDVLRPRYRKPAHPGPWMVALLPALAKSDRVELRVFIAHRAIRKRCVVERNGVVYEGLPTLALERFGRKTLYHQYSIPVVGAVRRYRPDFVHAFGFETGAALIGCRTGFPVSCFIQGIAEKCFPYYGNRDWMDRNVTRWGERKAVGKVRWMVAETEFARNWALASNPRAHVELIPHPLRTVFLDEAAPTHEPRVLSVGGLDDRKGMDTIVKAFARVGNPEARLVLAGSGPLRAELERLAGDLGVAKRVDFLGSLSTEQVIAEMNRARVFVIGSRVDTSPNVVSEAHAVGVPIVGTNAGGIPEMIESGRDGFIVDVDDSVAMAEKMDLLLGDRRMAEEMGRQGREKVRVLNDPMRIAEQHLRYFEKIMEDLRETRKGSFQ